MLALAQLFFAVDIGRMKLIALVVFFGFWLAVLVRLLLTRSDRYRKAAHLPLEEDPATTQGKGVAHHG